MASGIQDWWRRGSIDIIAQTLAETYARPVYGAFNEAGYTGVVGAGVTQELWDLTGTGMVYGGYGRCDFTASGINSWFRLTIDGTEVAEKSIGLLVIEELDMNFAQLFYLLRYQAAPHNYAVGLSHPFTFESSIKGEFYNATAGNANVSAFMYYALV